MTPADVNGFLVIFLGAALVFITVGLPLILHRNAKFRRRRELQARWFVEPRSDEGYGEIAVKLVLRGSGGERVRVIEFPSVDTSEDGWSEKLDVLLADASNKAGVLNANLP